MEQVSSRWYILVNAVSTYFLTILLFSTVGFKFRKKKPKILITTLSVPLHSVVEGLKFGMLYVRMFQCF